MKILLKGKPGNTYLLLGNEAIARGGLEAGISVYTCYPGTPSSEIVDTVAAIAGEIGVYVEYSTNEIVATEVAAGASYSGIPSLTAMKMVGVNVASDALFTLAYTGTPGGMIIVSADDPNVFSSQNEQDNRLYAPHMQLPMLEPADPQEAKEMVKYGLNLSRKYEIPLLMRTTTRVSHTRGKVVFNDLADFPSIGNFKRNVERYVAIPRFMRKRHVVLLDIIERLREESERSPCNEVISRGGEIGIVSSGVSTAYVLEIVERNNLKAEILKLGFTYPLPRKMISGFLSKYDEVLVVEELEPYLEDSLKAIAHEAGLNTKVLGKQAGFPRHGELNPKLVREIILGKIGKKIKELEKIDVSNLPNRPPVLCPGCPHRASFYVLRRVFPLESNIFATDIGCYGLGIFPPLNVGDTLLAMGGSIGLGMGLSLANRRQRVIAIIGDSTFYHAGIPGLINSIYNGHPLFIVILDNAWTAMTGHQPNPGTGLNALGKKAPKISIEKICDAVGIREVYVLDPFDVKNSTKILKKLSSKTETSVVIFRSPCAIVISRKKRRTGEKIRYMVVNKSKCTKCLACISQIACPAIYRDEEDEVKIDRELCVGCKLCATICPFNAIFEGGEKTP